MFAIISQIIIYMLNLPICTHLGIRLYYTFLTNKIVQWAKPQNQYDRKVIHSM